MGIEEVTLPIVLGTALVDSINPCVIGVMVLLLATLLKLSKNKNYMVKVGLIYILAVYVTYTLAGLGLIWFQKLLIQLGFATALGIIIGIVIIFAGIIEIKDYFWYGEGFSLAIPVKYAQKIKKMIAKISIPGAILLGIFASIVELPCTGGPYLAITALLANQFDGRAFGFLLLYNFIFVLPIIVILLLAYFGTSVKKIEQWKQRNKKYMRLVTGLLLLGLGAFLIAYYGGWLL